MSDAFKLLVPQMNPNDEHAVLVRWNVPSTTRVDAGQSVATMETTKTAFDVEAPRGGYIFYSIAPKTLIAVGSRLAWICDENVPPPADSPAASEAETQADVVPIGDPRITRKALHLMRQHALSPSDVPSSAERIEVADVERILQQRGAGSTTPSGVPGNCTSLEQSPSKMIEVQALGQVYGSAIPSLVSLSIDCRKNGARLYALSQQYGPLSLLELAIFEVARLLGSYPDLNGYYENGRAWRYKSVAIGFAINLGRSLRVPVVHRCSELSPIEIARSVRNLSLQYLRDELELSNLTGGTFTVTDLSSQGVEHFVPVLNLRQSAILGICAERPASGRRNLVMTFDHRMSDGMRAAGFLAALRDRLEADPQA